MAEPLSGTRSHHRMESGPTVPTYFLTEGKACSANQAPMNSKWILGVAKEMVCQHQGEEAGSARNLHVHYDELREEIRKMMQVEGIWVAAHFPLRVLRVRKRRKVSKQGQLGRLKTNVSAEYKCHKGKVSVLFIGVSSELRIGRGAS